MQKFAVLPVAFACNKQAEITVGMMIMHTRLKVFHTMGIFGTAVPVILAVYVYPCCKPYCIQEPHSFTTKHKKCRHYV
jgi:hypothetical protein